MIPYHIRVVYHKYAHQGSLELLNVFLFFFLCGFPVLSPFRAYFFILEVTIVSGMPKNKKRWSCSCRARLFGAHLQTAQWQTGRHPACEVTWIARCEQSFFFHLQTFPLFSKVTICLTIPRKSARAFSLASFTLSLFSLWSHVWRNIFAYQLWFFRLIRCFAFQWVTHQARVHACGDQATFFIFLFFGFDLPLP